VKPVLQALVLAERVYEDKSTGRKIIAGTITELLLVPKKKLSGVSVSLPQPDGTLKNVRRMKMQGALQGSLFAYISLTGVHDGTKLGLQFVSLKKNKVMFGAGIAIACEDRFKTVEISLPLPPFDIPEPGAYAFEVTCEGEIIGSARIVAKEIEESEDEDSETRGEI
jgi:hypothetical protein